MCKLMQRILQNCTNINYRNQLSRYLFKFGRKLNTFVCQPIMNFIEFCIEKVCKNNIFLGFKIIVEHNCQ